MTDSILRSYYNVSSSTFVPVAGAAAAVGALALLSGETDGFAIDATTADGGTVAVINTGDPTDNLSNVILDASNLVQSGTSPKMVHNVSSPYVRWSPHNLTIQSQTFDNAAWTASSTTITANNTTAPDGSSTADLSTSTGSNGRIQEAAGRSFTSATISIYVKASTATWFLVEATDFATQAFGSWFNISTGTVGTAKGTGGASLASASVISVGSGWYRVIITGTFSTALTAYSHFDIVNADNDQTSTAALSAWLWGAQLNKAGYTATPYLATVASTRIGIPQSYDAAAAQYGILVEPAATNLILRSEEFGNASWTKSNTTISADSTTAPDGSSTADSLIAAGAGSVRVMRQAATTVAASTYTASIFAKQAVEDWIFLEISDFATAGAGYYFDLVNGVSGSSSTVGGVTLIDKSIVSVGGGWFRCSVTVTVDNTSYGMQVFIAEADSDSTVDDLDSVYLWGAQLELGTVATSYSPTLGSTVSRATDNITAPLTSVPSLSTAVSNYFEAKLLRNDVNGTVFFAIDDGTTGDKVIHYNNTGSTADWLVSDGGVPQATVAGLGNWPSTIFKAGGRATANDFNHALNGIAATADTTGTYPTTTTFRIGNFESVSTGYTGVCYIYYMVTLPRAMNNSELVSATT